jgi:hypothetical protein
MRCAQSLYARGPSFRTSFDREKETAPAMYAHGKHRQK